MEIDVSGDGDACEAKKDEVFTFSVKEFSKKLLNGDDDVVRYMRTFVKRSSDHSKVDVVLEFMTESSTYDPSQLTHLLTNRRPSDEIVAIFNFLEVVLLRISDDLREHEPWAIAVVRELMQRGVVPVFISGLNGKDTNRMMATLRLLTSMVTSGLTTASEVANGIRLDVRTLRQLLSNTKNSAAADVRTSTIHFLMSFLVTGNENLINYVLFNRGFKLIFNQLHKDKLITIEIFLRTLLTKVVNNTHVSKSVKVRVFDSNVLNGVLQLFKWNDPSISKLKRRKLDGDEATKARERLVLIRQMAYEFVHTLCCSSNPKTNIVFMNNNSETLTRNVNLEIGKFLSSNAKLYQDPLVEDLFVSIFKAVPSEVPSYLKGLRNQLAVEATDRYIRIISYIRKIFAAIDPIQVLGSSNCALPANKLAAMMTNVITTSELNRKVLFVLLQHKNIVIRHQGVVFIGTVLEKASCLMNENNTRLKSVLEPDNLSDFVKEFKKQLLKMLPPSNCLLQCLNLAFSSDNLRENGTDRKDEGLKAVVNAADHIHATVTTIVNYSRIDGCSLKENLNAISEDLFEVLSTVKDSDEEVTTKIRLSILGLISDSEMGKTLLVQTVLDKSVALFICEAVNSCCGSSAVQLLKTLLLRTGRFEAVGNEVDVWIEQLTEWSTLEESAKIVDFFAGVVVHLVRDVDTLIDAQKELCLKAVGSSAKDEKRFYDKLFDEILLEEDSSDTEGRSNLESKPFSLMVFAALDLLESTVTTSDDLRSEFLGSVLSDVIHTQNDVAVLCSVLKRYEKILPKRFVKYLRSLNPSEEEEEDLKAPTPSKKKFKMLKVVNRKGITSYLRRMFQKRRIQSIESEVAENVWNDLGDGDVTLVVQQVLIYLKVLAGKRSSLELVTFFCDFLKNIIKRRWSSSKTVQIIGNLILNHSVICEDFLHHTLLTNRKESGSMKKITDLVYETIPYLIDLNSFSYLVDRALDFILEKLRMLKDDEGSASMTSASLVHILDPFKEKLTIEMLRRLVDCLCEFTSTEMLNETKNGLSSVGRLLVCVLMAVSTKATEHQHILTLKQVAVIANLYKDVSTIVPDVERENLETELSLFVSGLLDILDSSSLYGHVLDNDFFEFCLKSTSAVDRKVLDATLRSNTWYFVRLERWLIESDLLETEPSKYAKIVLTFLRFHGTSHMGTVLRGKKTVRLLANIVKCYLPLIVGKLLRLDNATIEDDLDEVTAFNIFKILLCYEPPILLLEQKKEFYGRAEELVDSGGTLSVKTLEILHDIIVKDVGTVDGHVAVVTYVTMCLKCLQTLESVAVVDKKRMYTTVYFASKMLERNKHLPRLMETLKEFKIWKPFLTVAVKWSMRDVRGVTVLELMSNLLKTLHAGRVLKSSRASKVFVTIVGHQNLVSGLLDMSFENRKWKGTLLDLLLFLVKVNPLLCHSDHIPTYLAAYEPLLNWNNEKILHLLLHYERNGVSMQRFEPIVWGQTAAKRYSVVKNDRFSFRGKLQMAEIVELLDKNTMLKTAVNFPLTLPLYDDNNTEFSKYEKGMYDPRFLLPLLGNMLSSDTLKWSTKFIVSNSLSLAFASLGSANNNMRAAGYFVLNAFYRHLEICRFNGRHIWMYLLDIVRNAMTDPCTRLPSVITSFLIKVCALVQNPTAAVAAPIINFLFTKPILDIHDVPEFYIMFSSSDVKHRVFRTWILDILVEGLRTPADFQLCQRRHVFKIILGYFESQLASQQCKIKILGVLKSATKIRSTTFHMFEQHGVLAFLQSVVRNRSTDHEITSEVIEVLHSSWSTLIGQVERIVQDTTVTKKSSKHISTLLLAEFQLLMVSVLDHLSYEVALQTFDKYITTFSSFFRYTAMFDKEVDFYVPGITTVSLRKLLKLYASVVSKREHNNAWTGPDFAHVKNCKKAIYEIVTNWRCHSTTSSSTGGAHLPNFDTYVEVLTTAVKLLLNNIRPCLKTHGKLIQVYGWLTKHLENDRSGAVTRSLLRSDDSEQNIVLPLLAACEYLLKAMVSGAISLRKETDQIDPLIVLARLDLVFVAIGRNLLEGDVSLDSTSSWATFCALLRKPEVCGFVEDLKGDDGPFKSFSAVSLTLLLCESFLREDDTTYAHSFIRNVKKLKKFDEKNFEATEIETKRSSPKRKKDQTDKRITKKRKESD